MWVEKAKEDAGTRCMITCYIATVGVFGWDLSPLHRKHGAVILFDKILNPSSSKNAFMFTSRALAIN